VIRSARTYREGRDEPMFMSLEHAGLRGRHDGRYVFPLGSGYYYRGGGSDGAKTVTYRFVQAGGRRQ